MIFSPPGRAEERIAKDLANLVETELCRVGLLFRVFSRVKTPQSIERKLSEKLDEYKESNRKMQDSIGIRIALYFSDDSDTAQKCVKSLFEFDSDSISSSKDHIFGPVRCNLIFKIPSNLVETTNFFSQNPYIDEGCAS